MHRLLAPALALGFLMCACSSSTSAAESWAGSWTLTGTETTTCSGKTQTSPLGETVRITLGSGDGTFETSLTCGLAWTVGASDSNVATLAPGSGCAASLDGSSATVAFTKASATLDESTITGTVEGTASNGCTLSESLTLTRDAIVPQGSR